MKNFYKTLIFTIFFLSFMLNFKVFATEEETIILPNISYQSYNEYDDEEYTFDIVNKKFKKKILSKSKDFSVEYTGLEEGKTNIHPIQVDKKGTYLFEFGKDTYGSFTILIADANGNDICYEEKELKFKKWTISLKLDVGKYSIKILSRECIDLDYSLYARHSKMRKTINLKMTSCDTRKLEPGFGKGTWKTSDKNIVLITNKKDLASVGNIRAKKNRYGNNNLHR
ncbi:MAG: hypothetical protein IJN88_04765 [Clostridia bacterium]|nr:hypothetical protein [Clostridia bacterium]